MYCILLLQANWNSIHFILPPLVLLFGFFVNFIFRSHMRSDFLQIAGAEKREWGPISRAGTAAFGRRFFACSNFLISLRTQCAYIPYSMVFVHTYIAQFLGPESGCGYVCVWVWGCEGGRGGAPFAKAKRLGTYFNCSLLGHEVAQLGAQIPRYPIWFIYIHICVCTHICVGTLKD